jgi:hypothetical protein
MRRPALRFLATGLRPPDFGWGLGATTDALGLAAAVCAPGASQPANVVLHEVRQPKRTPQSPTLLRWIIFRASLPSIENTCPKA